MPGSVAAAVRHTKKFESNGREESQDHDAVLGVLGNGNSQVAPSEEEPKVDSRMGRVTFVAERECSRCVTRWLVGSACAGEAVPDDLLCQSADLR
jgi:hypothetical protein